MLFLKYKTGGSRPAKRLSPSSLSDLVTGIERWGIRPMVINHRDHFRPRNHGESVYVRFGSIYLIAKKDVWVVLSRQNMHSLQVPSHANEIPFTADGFHPSEQELPEAHNSFDDTEDRFDSAFSSSIECPTIYCL